MLSPPTPLTPPAALSSSGSLVGDRFAQAQLYGDYAWATAWNTLQNLAAADYPIEWEAPIWSEVPDSGLGGITADRPTVPTVNEVSMRAVDFLGLMPVMPDITIDAGTVPDFNVTDPQFQMPDAPNVEMPIFTDNQPSVSDPDIPTKPEYDLPAVPRIDDITIPDAPDYDLPAFDAEEPVEDLTPPEPMFVWNEVEYNSDLKEQVAAKLLADIIAGGSGLDEETEQAIYDRATSRQEIEHQQLYNEALDFFASRGFRLPPGALAGRLQEASYQITRTREDLNNDILVNQSKLAQENTHFIIDKAVVWEKQLMDYTNQYQQRAFDAAKYVVESALVIYQAKVEAFKARLAAYQTKAEVYRTRIQAEALKAEIYKAIIEGVRARVDVQQAMVAAYTAQVQAVSTWIELYKAEMQGAQIRAQIDSVRVENYRSLIEAYKARIGAVTAQYDLYQARLSGEKTKADLYSAQVGAYKARVDAFKAVSDVDIAQAKAQTDIVQAEVEIYKGQIARYAAEVDAAIKQVAAEIDIEKLGVEVYDADVRRYATDIDALAAAFAARVEEAKAKVDMESKTAETITRTAVAKYGLATGISEAAARIASQLAASALSMVSASAALGYSEGRSDSTSFSVGMSSSSTSSNTGYNHPGTPFFV